MMILYHILSTAFALVTVPGWILYSGLTGKKRRGLWHHFGAVPPLSETEASNSKTVWLHALSLGEVKAAAPVLAALKERQPDLRIAVSVTTDTGYDGAHQHLAFADQIFFHPFDCTPFVFWALSRVRPDGFVLMDTGFWPGFLHLLRIRRIPAILLNGRLSERSLKRYRRLGNFARQVFGSFTCAGMQSDEGAAAMQSLGLDPSRVHVFGDPKFDGLRTFTDAQKQARRSSMNIPSERPVWVAGSTHAGEEEILLDAHRKLRKRFPDLLLILAPRRLERVADIATLLQARNISFQKRSEIESKGPAHPEVLLLDTMGELAGMYGIAQAAFVGRSLLPPGGGHSLLEPIASGVPVLHGPFIENVRHVAKELRQAGLAFEVQHADEVQSVLGKILRDPETGGRVVDKAQDLLARHQGAAAHMTDLVLQALEGKTL